MSTDRNAFDTWLKEKLYRDVLFRAVLWSTISAVALLIAQWHGDVGAYQFFERAAVAITPVVNSVGTFAFVLAIFAMLFKDLEFVDPGRYGQISSAGRFGGFVRRVAGDLTLWVLGGLVSLLSAAGFATAWGLAKGLLATSEAIALGSLYLLLGMMFVVATFLNVIVRREAPPLTGYETMPAWLKTPKALVPAYSLAIVLLVVRIFTA